MMTFGMEEAPSCSKCVIALCLRAIYSRFTMSKTSSDCCSTVITQALTLLELLRQSSCDTTQSCDGAMQSICSDRHQPGKRAFRGLADSALQLRCSVAAAVATSAACSMTQFHSWVFGDWKKACAFVRTGKGHHFECLKLTCMAFTERTTFGYWRQ